MAISLHIKPHKAKVHVHKILNNPLHTTSWPTTKSVKQSRSTHKKQRINTVKILLVKILHMPRSTVPMKV